MNLNEEQATEQLRVLVESTTPLPIIWEPLKNIGDDYDVLEYVRNSEDLCQGKKEDFNLLLGSPINYHVGDYGRTILLVLGVRIK
jgi:hypothetical protein